MKKTLKEESALFTVDPKFKKLVPKVVAKGVKRPLKPSIDPRDPPQASKPSVNQIPPARDSEEVTSPKRRYDQVARMGFRRMYLVNQGRLCDCPQCRES